MTPRWALVGRTAELTLLSGVLQRDDRHGVMLSGAPGVGKTRLARELLDHAASEGRITAWTVGTRSMASVPFGAFAHLLPLDATASSPGEVIGAVTGELRRRSPARPLVLGVDDAHLLDEPSAELACHLARTGAAFVVGTVHGTERLPAAITAMWTEGIAERLELQPLSAEDVAELLSGALGGQVDSSTTHRLWRLSRGNVLFLRELVLLGSERGALAQRYGVWSWSGEPIPGERVAELVEDRLAGLTRQQRAALDVLALGEPLPAPLFADIVGRRVLEQLERRTLVSVDLQGRRSNLRLAHPLYAEALRARLGPVRRQAVFRRLADALASTPGRSRRDDVLRLALWRLDGGGGAEPAAMIAAARWARSAFDLALAERLARAALDGAVLDGAVLDGGGCGEPAVLLGDVLHWQGRHVEAREVLERHAPDRGSPNLLAQWAIVASATLLWGLGEVEQAERTVAAVDRDLPPGQARDRLAGHRAMLAHSLGRPDEALRIATPILERDDVDLETRVRVSHPAVFAFAALGRCDEAIRLASSGAALARRLPEQRDLWLGEFAFARAMACCQAGRYREMADLAWRVHEEVIKEPRHDVRGLWTLLLGRAALGAGLPATARARLREAVALLREQDIGGLLAWALSCLARSAALLGDLPEARRAQTERDRVRLAPLRMFDGDADLSDAWVAAAAGELSTARRLARRAAERAAAVSQCSVEIEALHDAVRLGEPQLQAELEQAARRTDSVLAPAFVAHAAALATGDGARLDRCAERFRELGVPLLAAEATAAGARAHQRAGRTDAARRSSARSAELVARCEGATTPALHRWAPSFATLTTREREIAVLVARGLPNRDIAARLTLSIRTVGNHLNHIYGKLGASDRAGLVAALGFGGDGVTA